MPRFVKTFETTADTGLEISSPDPAGIYELAGEGLTSITTDPETIEPAESVTVSLEAADPAALLVKWLSELIFLRDSRGFIGKKFTVRSCSDTGLTAEIEGETFDSARHPARLEVKAATYHGLAMDKKPDGFIARVILDI